jgi:hypothetical protein
MTGDRAEREAAVRRVLESNGIRTKPGRSYTVAPGTSPEIPREALEQLYFDASGLAQQSQDPGARLMAEKAVERLEQLLDESTTTNREII